MALLQNKKTNTHMKKTLHILTIFTLSISAYSQVPNYVPSNGLVGWWPFNGNANDESGNGNNGTVNGATLTIDRFGNANQAYGFDGNDWIECAFNPLFNVGIGSFSIACWANRFGGNPFQHLVTRNQITVWPNALNSYALRYENSGIAFFSAGNPNTNNAIIISPNIPNLNLWNQIIAVFNAQDFTIRIYINGILATIGSVNPNIQNYDNSGGLFFGVEHPTVAIPSGPQFLNGSLDDIGIWNRALTECEIQNLYLAQLGSQAISAGADQSICSGNPVTLNGSGGSSYQWNNNVMDGQAFTPNQSANYVLNGTDSLGCQGTDTVVVSVLDNGASSLTQTALDSYTLNGQTYTQSGTYTQVVPAANGCDSTITLNLTLNFTGIHELGNSSKILVKITDLNGKIIQRRKNTVMLFIYEDGTVERVVEME
jgi:hypothetical protein